VKARVLESYRETAENGNGWFQGGGDIAALRAYQAYHPNAAIYSVTYRGRTVWMTSKQRAIWSELQAYWKRGKRDTLARIAKVAHCSRASVSRFLRRLDLWRFIDLITIRGRNGGTWIMTRRTNEPYQKWTLSARNRARQALARARHQQMLDRIEPELTRYKLGRLPKPDWWKTAEQVTYRIGSTDATFTRLSGIRRSQMQ
jgi:hypothetical protein